MAEARELLAGLVVGERREPPRLVMGLRLSVVLHVLGIGALVAVPLLAPEPARLLAVFLGMV